MIKIFATDVDGTLTDGKINISENGEIFKSFNVKDGLGFKLLLENNIVPIIITGRNSKILINRANELGIQKVYQNVKDKALILDEICNEFNVNVDEIAYIGDDINDLPIIDKINCSFAPCDAICKVKDSVNHICTLNGGAGAVREAIDIVIDKNKSYIE